MPAHARVRAVPARVRVAAGNFGIVPASRIYMKWFSTRPFAQNPGPGLYQFRRDDGNGNSRIHLRLDPDGHGTLIVNANRILHLNPTAALMTFFILEAVPEDHAINALRKAYRVGLSQARSDLAGMRSQVDELIRPDGACPIHDLDLETVAPFSTRPTAPYRFDLALTYRCNNDCSHCYNVQHPPRAGKDVIQPGELGTGEWKRIIDKAWDLGIPHIIFTGGEPTLRDDLPELISHAEHNGQITGLNTNARRLADRHYVEALLDSGLDHVQITLESSSPKVHDEMVGANGAFQQTVQGIRNALASPLYVMTNTTMLHTNVSTISGTLDFLADLGVSTIGLNALIYSGRGATVGTGLLESDLPPILALARKKTEAHDQRLIWYTPTQYCNFDPVQMDLGVKGCTAALYNMCIEPDGGVIPCQSYYHRLGYILEDSWDSIWDHELAIHLRERRGLPEKCTGCLLLSECGGGCPLQFEKTHSGNERL